MVCNAAILADRNAKPTELSEATFQRVLAVNLTGTFLCAQTAAWHMIERGRGQDHRTADITGREPQDIITLVSSE